MALVGIFLLGGAVSAQAAAPATFAAPPPLRADAEVGRQLVELEKALSGLDGALTTSVNEPARTSLLARLHEIQARMAELRERVRAGETPASAAALPIDDGAFERLEALLRGEAFEKRRLALLQEALQRNHVSAFQLRRLIDTFNFTRTKLEAVRAALPVLTDPANGFELYDAFTFEADRQQLRTLLGSLPASAP